MDKVKVSFHTRTSQGGRAQQPPSGHTHPRQATFTWAASPMAVARLGNRQLLVAREGPTVSRLWVREQSLEGWLHPVHPRGPCVQAHHLALFCSL